MNKKKQPSIEHVIIINEVVLLTSANKNRFLFFPGLKNEPSVLISTNFGIGSYFFRRWKYPIPSVQFGLFGPQLMIRPEQRLVTSAWCWAYHWGRGPRWPSPPLKPQKNFKINKNPGGNLHSWDGVVRNHLRESLYDRSVFLLRHLDRWVSAPFHATGKKIQNTKKPGAAAMMPVEPNKI